MATSKNEKLLFNPLGTLIGGLSLYYRYSSKSTERAVWGMRVRHEGKRQTKSSIPPPIETPTAFQPSAF